MLLTDARTPESRARRQGWALESGWRAAAAVVLLAAVVACSPCKDTTISAANAGGVAVTVHHRVCGSVAAYAVRIAPVGINVPRDPDALEPFMMVCDCYVDRLPRPVRLVTKPGGGVLIQYDASRVWEIVKQRTLQGSVPVSYQAIGRRSAAGSSLPQ
jgi:hypothetical protein